MPRETMGRIVAEQTTLEKSAVPYLMAVDIVAVVKPVQAQELVVESVAAWH